MKTNLISSPKEKIDADSVAIFLCEASSEIPKPGAFLDPLTTDLVSELYAQNEFKGANSEIAFVHRPSGFRANRLLLVGLGSRSTLTLSRLRQAAGVALRFANKKGVRHLALTPPDEIQPGDAVQALVEGSVLAKYEPNTHQTSSIENNSVVELTVLSDKKWEDRFNTGVAISEAQNFTRTLVNEPGNLLTPTKLMHHAKDMCRSTDLKIKVLDQSAMKNLGMGALLGVAQGSAEPPNLIVVEYHPVASSHSDIHLGLVGKAVTFDTGGISIKPSEDMGRMKYDMAGGGAMLGSMMALATLKPKIRVTAIVPSVENMLGAKAQRPGDVVTSMSGKTVEVLNTDAEGRLILADALTYAKNLGCTHLVDAATLTGAIVVALGHERVGAFTNSPKWLDQIEHAANTAGEKFWPMPLDKEYRELLTSPIADLANIGPRWGGAITAAMFLKEFADPVPWVHLDIAGTAWIEDEKPHISKGPSGIPVRTLTSLAMNLS